MILMQYSSVMLSIINQLRLRSMMIVDAHELPKIKEKKVQESVENVALNPCLGNKQAVDAKNKLDSNIIPRHYGFKHSN